MTTRALAVVTLVVAIGARAGAAPSAETVLSNVQHFYAGANQLTADFRQTVHNATFDASKDSQGRLWVKKPSDFRLDYLAKRDGRVAVIKSFVFDGTTLWVVDHPNRQILQEQVQSSILPAALSFLTGGSARSSQFEIALAPAGRYGSRGDVVLELTPKQPSAQYTQLFFVVDPADWRVKESIVIDSGGDTNDFSFYAPDLKSPVKASLFHVAPASLPTYRLVRVQQAGSAAATPHAPAGTP